MSPASAAMPRRRFRLTRYWSTIASGALAAHFAVMSGWSSPFLVGRSKKKGGFFGFGDHAAADANCAFVWKSAFSNSSIVLMDSARGGPPRPGQAFMPAVMQQGLSA